MYLIIYFLIISFIFRLFLSLIYSQPGLAFILLILFAIFTVYNKRKNNLQGWVHGPHARANYYSNQGSTQNSHTSTSNKKDVFEAEYTEQEVH